MSVDSHKAKPYVDSLNMDFERKTRRSNSSGNGRYASMRSKKKKKRGSRPSLVSGRKYSSLRHKKAMRDHSSLSTMFEGRLTDDVDMKKRKQVKKTTIFVPDKDRSDMNIADILEFPVSPIDVDSIVMARRASLLEEKEITSNKIRSPMSSPSMNKDRKQKNMKSTSSSEDDVILLEDAFSGDDNDGDDNGEDEPKNFATLLRRDSFGETEKRASNRTKRGYQSLSFSGQIRSMTVGTEVLRNGGFGNTQPIQQREHGRSRARSSHKRDDSEEAFGVDELEWLEKTFQKSY